MCMNYYDRLTIPVKAGWPKRSSLETREIKIQAYSAILPCGDVVDVAELRSILTAIERQAELMRQKKDLSTPGEITVKAMLESHADVKRVLKLEPRFSRWLYLIETPFVTFPRFVIGMCDEQGMQASVKLSCGTERIALERWSDIAADPYP